MKNKNLIILKLGGSVITHKKEGLKKINVKNLKRLSREISKAKKKKGFSLIIVHGVGSFGHIVAKKFNLNEGHKNKSQINAFPKLYTDIKTLNLEVIKELGKNSLNVVPFQQSSAWKLSNKRLKKHSLSIIENYLDLDLIPILHGDILIDDKLGFSILSGDQIAYYLGKNLGAKRVIIGTDTDGIFTCDPRINKNAKLIKVADKEYLKRVRTEQSAVADVTGGMEGKVKELMKLVTCGIESEIINISKPKTLEKSLCGQKNLGTLITK